MADFTVELGLRRGVWYWWLFCLLSTTADLIGLAKKTQVTLVLGISTLVVAATHRIQQRRQIAVHQWIGLVVNTISLCFGFANYAITAVIAPRCNAFLKLLVITAFVQASIQVAKRNPDSQRIWRHVQTWSGIPRRIQDRLKDIHQLSNPAIRLPAVALAYIALWGSLFVVMIYVVNYDFPSSELPWLRRLARKYRLRLRSFLFHHLWKNVVNHYVYIPIQGQSDKTKKIRLLRLLKRRPLSELRYELVEIDLRLDPVYDAISYHWGDGEKTEPIFISGKVMLVSPTVTAVLYHLSSYKEDRFVWIDSICINQRDNEEKGSQISLMRDIYRSASKTVVWLDGVHEPGKVRTMLAKVWYHYTCTTTETCLQFLREQSESDVLAGWMQLMNLFANPWFFRVWVVQEVATASSVEVLASGEPLNWDHLVTMAELWLSPTFSVVLSSSPLPGLEDIAAVGQFNTRMMAVCRRNHDFTYTDLVSLLDMTTSFRSTEVVDKIYGLLGMLDPADNVHGWLVADYSKSVKEVYTLVAKQFVAKYPNVILSNAGMGFLRNLTTLPSWVPDWTSLSIYDTRRQPFIRSSGYSRYNASAGSTLEIKWPSNLSLYGEFILRIKGHRFDTINCVGPTLTFLDQNRGLPTEKDGEIMLKFFKGHMSARKMATTLVQDPYPPTGQPVEEAFWRCLTGDTDRARPAPPELGLHCRLWERFLRSKLDAAALQASEDREETAALLLHDDTNTVPSIEQLRALGLENEALRVALMWNTTRAKGCAGRAFAVTQSGYMALVPPGTVAGDAVCLLYGVDTPFIVRMLSIEDASKGGDMKIVSGPEEGIEIVSLVGESYVHGVMDGEANMHNSAQSQMFHIV